MKSKVYYSKNNFDLLLLKLPKKLRGKIGIKLHFGEPGSTTYLKPKYVQKLYDQLLKDTSNISLVECNVLYKGDRSNKTGHLKVAKDHGYDFAPIDICDGENGDESWKIAIDKKYFKEISVGKNLKKYNNLVVISHFKGHPSAGFGGALKNLGMGLGSREGKMAMHNAFDLNVNEDICTGCGNCASHCGGNAIEVINNKAHIDQSKCIHCAGCITNCPNEAIAVPWGSTSPKELQERIVEYCYGIMKSINCPVFINILEDITPKCDCFDTVQKPMTPDLGFIISDDPVAIDQASFDLVKKATGKDMFKGSREIDSLAQVKYGEEIGLGSSNYELIEL